jgi:signal transduction histidine kinase
MFILGNPFFAQNKQKSIDSIKSIMIGSSREKLCEYHLQIAELHDLPDKKIESAKIALNLAKYSERSDLICKSLIMIGQGFVQKLEIDSAIYYYSKGFEYFKYFDDREIKAKLFTAMGLAYERKYMFSLANEYHFKALAINRELKDKKAISYSLTNIGLNNWRTGEYKEAEKYYLEALKLRLEINDKRALAITYNNLGVLHWNWGNYFKALKYYLSSLELKDEAKDSNGLVLSYNNIGLLYQKFGDFEKTKEYYYKGLEIATKVNYLFGIAYSNENLGYYFLQQKLYNEADNYFQKALQQYKDINHKGGQCNIYNHLGNLNYQLNNINDAINYYQKAYQVAQEASDKKATILTYNNLGKSYNQLKDYSKAKFYLNNALELMKEEKLPDFIKDTYAYLAEAHENSGDIKQALNYLKLYKATSDSLYSSENFRVINDFKEKYEAERRDKENEALKAKALLQAAELEKQSYLRNFGIILIIFFIIAILYLVKSNSRKKLQNQEILAAKEKVDKLYEELKLAMEKITASEKTLKEANATKDKFFSIIAHDLRNPFMSILGFLDLLTNSYNEYDETDRIEMIKNTNSLAVNTFKLLENLLQWSRLQTEGIQFYPRKINITKLIKNTIDTLKPGANLKSINLSLITNEQIDFLGDEDMLNTIFRNLISNSIKFTPEKGFIVVEIKKELKKLIVQITDSGIGMDSETVENLFKITKVKSKKGTKGEKGTGIGLILTYEFIEKHNGKISVESELGKGSKFIIEFPIANIE